MARRADLAQPPLLNGHPPRRRRRRRVAAAAAAAVGEGRPAGENAGDGGVAGEVGGEQGRGGLVPGLGGGQLPPGRQVAACAGAGARWDCVRECGTRVRACVCVAFTSRDVDLRMCVLKDVCASEGRTEAHCPRPFLPSVQFYAVPSHRVQV